jgi:hypothetical protein
MLKSTTTLAGLAAMTWALLGAQPAWAATRSVTQNVTARNANTRACYHTADAARTACLFEGLDDFWVSAGKCKNFADAEVRKECLQEAREAISEKRAECRAQRAARRDLCDDLGQAPYDPPFDPANFVNPADIGGSVAPNPFLPLIRGRTWVYHSDEEEIRVTVTDAVKLVAGVPCAVVRDIVSENGNLIEDTNDWMAQDLAGNVWYCGEETAEYEDGFPVSTEGSFEAGVDGAKPGILMKAAPAVGDIYRQEFDLGNAEDDAEVIDLAGSANVPVPGASCNGDCLVIQETTALSPDALEHKYYKAGVGLILEHSPESGSRTELVEIIN